MSSQISENTQDVKVVITVDNSYIFGFGDVNGINQQNLFGNINNIQAGDIFNCSTGPETYTITRANEDTYLYLIAWSDETTSQGALAQFELLRDGDIITTGSPGWEVYATGIDFDGNTSPTLTSINAEIQRANAASGAAGNTSITWVDENSTQNGVLATEGQGNTLGNVCAALMPNGPSWMWYNSDPTNIANPFSTNPLTNNSEGHHEYLIFRIQVAFKPLDVDVARNCDNSSFDVNVRSDGEIVDRVWYEYNNTNVDLCNDNCGTDPQLSFSISDSSGSVTVFATSQSTPNNDFDTLTWNCPNTCDVPQPLAVNPNVLSDTSAEFIWRDLLGQYNLRFWEISDESARNYRLGFSGGRKNIGRLTPGITYRWQLQKVCSQSNQSSWVEGPKFHTGNELVCPQVNSIFSAVNNGLVTFSAQTSQGQLPIQTYLIRYAEVNTTNWQTAVISDLNAGLAINNTVLPTTYRYTMSAQCADTDGSIIFNEAVYGNNHFTIN